MTLLKSIGKSAIDSNGYPLFRPEILNIIEDYSIKKNWKDEKDMTLKHVKWVSVESVLDHVQMNLSSIMVDLSKGYLEERSRVTGKTIKQVLEEG
jgi:fructose/tagatose bisphosphate aldolase